MARRVMALTLMGLLGTVALAPRASAGGHKGGGCYTYSGSGGYWGGCYGGYGYGYGGYYVGYGYEGGYSYGTAYPVSSAPQATYAVPQSTTAPAVQTPASQAR